MANAILNFHFDYLTPSLTCLAWIWGILNMSCMVNQASLSYLNQASLKVSIAILTLSIEFLLRFFTLQIALFD